MTQADENQEVAKSELAQSTPEPPPARSLIEQIVDKTIERLGTSDEITATARGRLRDVLLADRLPTAAEVTTAAKTEEASRANP